MADPEALVGRAPELAAALSHVRAGRRLLIRGRAGIGKRALMRALYATLRAEPGHPGALIWVPQGHTKTALLAFAEQLHEALGLRIALTTLPPQHRARLRAQGYLPWSALARSVGRLTLPELTALLLRSLAGRRVRVFIETLAVPPVQARFYGQLLEAAQVVAALDSGHRRSRIGRLLWQFNATIELKGLSLAHARTLAERTLQTRPVRFSDERTRERWLRAVAQESGGHPEAIQRMVETAAAETEITPAKAREVGHEAGRRYFDMTPLVLIALIGFAALRYISRGLGERELWLLAGLGTTAYAVWRVLYRHLKMKE